MNYNDVVGQNEIKDSLRYALVNDKVSHAYIFNGPRGIGKKTMARIFASMLLCKFPQVNGACGKCAPCKMFEMGTNPDLYVVKPMKSSISVDQIRELQEDIMVKPLYSERKVYIIEDADSMTVQAQNCLLKTLEEPPSYAVVILILENINSVTETIRSRAVRLNFKKNTYDEVYNYLSSKYNNDAKVLNFIASYSDGVIGVAEELLKSQEFNDLRESTIKMLTILCKPTKSESLEVSDFFDQNKEYINEVLDIMLMFYRDMLIVRETGDESLLINSDKKDIILLNAYNLTTSKILENIDTIVKTKINLEQNANYQLSVDVMLMKLRQVVV